jgi:hypothetical protein
MERRASVPAAPALTVTDRRKLDDPLAAPLARALAASLDHSGRECPEAETLALYFDRALATDETVRWEAHFAACARCQEHLAAMARMDMAQALAAPPEAARRPSGVAWLWNWRWLAPAAAALGALAIWVVVSNMQTTTRPTESTIAQNLKAEPSSEAAGATSPQKPEGAEPAPEDSKAAAPASGPAFAPAIGSTASGLASDAGAKPAAQPAPESKPSEAGKRAAATPLADRADTAASPKVPAATGTGALRAAPAVPSAKDKKEAAGEFALHAELQKPKEEAQLSREVRTAEVTAVPQQQPALNQQQGAVQAPSPAPARANEQPPQAGREAAQKTRVAPQAAQDELKKADSRAPAQAVQTVVVMPSPVPALRRERERDSRYRAANVAGAQVVWRLGPGGSIERSADGGATWQRQSSGVSADLLAGSAPSATVCWAVGRGGVVLRTTDGGTWTQLGSPTSQDLTAIVAVDADQATVTTADGKRYATTDGGRTWRSL